MRDNYSEVMVERLPSVLEPDEDLSLGELDLLGEFDAFFASEERLPHEPLFHRVQLSSREHRPAAAAVPAAAAAAVAMATRTLLVRLAVVKVPTRWRHTLAVITGVQHGWFATHDGLTRIENSFLQYHNKAASYNNSGIVTPFRLLADY